MVVLIYSIADISSLLSQAAQEADYLIVGLISDSSTKRLKGKDRPINDEQSRALLISSY
jgi:D-beta-D-heptose 7-phosphate kinase/D-beta-D-heptose 1-phosphate adenosyltransferase